MDRSRENLLAIGAFARAARLSLKALRLYDQLGLLPPAVIDPDSGYRYYHNRQLREARLIRGLRQMGLPLASIRQVLAEPPLEAETLLHQHVDVLEARAAEARRMIAQIVLVLRKKEDTSMALDVNVRMIDAQPIISLTHHTTVGGLYKRIVHGLDTLSVFVATHGGEVVGDPFGLYHGPINDQEDGPIEVCLPLREQIDAADAASSRVLPAGRLAYVVMHDKECSFPAILTGYDAVYDWIAANGYKATGSPREVWLSPNTSLQAKIEIAWMFDEAADAPVAP